MIYLKRAFAQDTAGLRKGNSTKQGPPATRGLERVIRPTRGFVAHINGMKGEIPPAL